MPNKFVSSWKAAGGTDTPSIREMGAAFDNLMPLILAAGGVIGPAGLAIAATIAAEDDLVPPLHVARPGPTNMLISTIVPSMATMFQQLSVMFLSTFTPPTPATALGLWQSTPAGAIQSPSSTILATAMSLYASSAFIGGVGDPSDPAPPPPPPEAPLFVLPPANRTVTGVGDVLFRYFTSTEDEGIEHGLAPNQVGFVAYVLPTEWTYTPTAVNYIKRGMGSIRPAEVNVYAWQFDDNTGASPVNVGAVAGTATGPEGPVELEGTQYYKPAVYETNSVTTIFQFPYLGYFDVTLTVCNAAGSITNTRTSIYSDG